MIVGIVVVVIGIVVSIALHEVGHMVPAKKFGVRVSQYFVGFGPTLWSKKIGETEYGVKAIPLGGFVRLIGMYRPTGSTRQNKTSAISQMIADARQASADEIAPGEDHRAFYRLSAPKKLIVMLGGPVMNLLIAIVLIAIATMGFGQQVVTTTIDTVVPCIAVEASDQDAVMTSPNCEDNQVESPAQLAGLHTGDQITSINGQPVSTWEQIPELLSASGGSQVAVTVLRDGNPVELQVVPVPVNVQTQDGTTTRYQIGISPAYQWEPQSISTVPGQVWDQVSATAKLVVQLPAKVYESAQSIWSDTPRGQDAVVSVVGVGRLAGEVTSTDFPGAPANTDTVLLLHLLASLNIALFVFNLIPLVPLDGGHVAGAIYEGIRRQYARLRHHPDPGPADTARMVPLASAMFVALVLMAVVMITADIVSPVSLS